jgi:hypothetical protein
MLESIPGPSSRNRPMRGRKPLPLNIAPDDAPSLQEIARSRSLPWYQVQRARIVLGVAAGEPTQDLALRTQCDRSTIWRTCRLYKSSGLPGLLAPPQRPGRPARISPPPAGPDRPPGLPGAGRQGTAHHSLDQPRSGTAGSRGWDRHAHQRPDDPHHPRRGGPPAAPHPVLENGPARFRV